MSAGGLRPARRALLLAAACACAVALTGCTVDAAVTITLDGGGGGTVGVELALDAEAVARVEVAGGTLEDRVMFSDLAAAGWTVSSWARDGDGGAAATLSHSFASTAGLERLLTDLGGAAAPVRDLEVVRERGVLHRRDAAKLEVDLRELTAGVANDEELAARLQQSGLDPAAVEERLRSSLAEGFGLTVTVVLPSGERRSVEVEPGARARLAAEASAWETGRVALLGAAAGLAVFSLLLLIVAAARPRR